MMLSRKSLVNARSTLMSAHSPTTLKAKQLFPSNLATCRGNQHTDEIGLASVYVTVLLRKTVFVFLLDSIVKNP